MTESSLVEPPFAVSIIGSAGRMGAMLASRLRELKYQVYGVDLALVKKGQKQEIDKEALARCVAQGQFVLLCTPVSTLKALASEVGALMRVDQILVDITSVKVLPLQWMKAGFSGPVIGTHPLFGPQPDPVDMRVALVEGHGVSAIHRQQIERIFTDLGCAFFWTTAEEHDKGVAITQSLNFAVSAAFFSTLARETDSIKYLTPSFKRHIEAARKHLTQDTAMFCEFTAMNPFFTRALEAYGQTLETLAAGGLEQVACEASVWYDEK